MQLSEDNENSTEAAIFTGKRNKPNLTAVAWGRREPCGRPAQVRGIRRSVGVLHPLSVQRLQKDRREQEPSPLRDLHQPNAASGSRPFAFRYQLCFVFQEKKVTVEPAFPQRDAQESNCIFYEELINIS